MVRTMHHSADNSARQEPQESSSKSQNASPEHATTASTSSWRLPSRKALLVVIIGFGCLFVGDIDVRLIFRLPPESMEKKNNASLRHATIEESFKVPQSASREQEEQILLDPNSLRSENSSSGIEEQHSDVPNDENATAAWHPSDQYKYRYDSEVNHHMNSDVMEFTDWENSAFLRLTAQGAGPKNLGGHCKPPPGIPKTCCPGSFSAGGSLNFKLAHECIPALERFPFLKQQTRDFFDDNTVPPTSTQCDICEIVEVARRNNLTIAFVGDSMQHQVFDGFACELYRRGYNVSMSKYKYPIVGDYYKQPADNVTLHVHSPTWDDDSTAVIQFYQIYKLPVINDGLDNITAQADVFVTGWGLHWSLKQREDYAIQMAALFQKIAQQGHVQLLVHRETSAQHWDADGGEYSLWAPFIAVKNLSLQCQPFQFNDSSVLWREKAVREAAERSGHDLVMAGPQMPAFTQTKNRPEVIVLPFFNYTAQHPKMHPVKGKKADCTHYCSTPFVYYPLWRSLRYALNRQFG